MISQVLSLWKTKNGLDSEGDYVYGVFDDIGFSINDESGGKLLVVSVIALSAESYKKIQELCKIMGGCFSSIKIGRVEDYLALFIPDSVPAVTVSDLDTIVQFVASNYASSGFVAHTKCCKCGQPSDSLTFKDQLVRPVCNSCAGSFGVASTNSRAVNSNSQYEVPKDPDNNWEDESFELNMNEGPGFKFDDDAFESNYEQDFYLDDSSSKGGGSAITGILGALVGAIIGVIPFIIVFSLTSSVISAACVLTSVMSVLIYMLFRGKRSTGFGSVLVLLFSILTSVVGTVYVSAKQYMAGSSFSGSIMEAVMQISPQSIAIQLVIAVVGSILGFLVLIGAFSKYCRK